MIIYDRTRSYMIKYDYVLCRVKTNGLTLREIKGAVETYIQNTQFDEIQSIQLEHAIGWRIGFNCMFSVCL